MRTHEPQPDNAPVGGASAELSGLRVRYWRRVRWLTFGLLSLWLLVTLAAPWFARELNQWRIGRFPLGFWLNSQGAIGLFVVLIACYAWMMDRLDRAYLQALLVIDGGAEACPRSGHLDRLQ